MGKFKGMHTGKKYFVSLVYNKDSPDRLRVAFELIDFLKVPPDFRGSDRETFRQRVCECHRNDRRTYPRSPI